MEFGAQLKSLGERISNQKVNIKTEEATKTGFILPFLQILGYDVFNPQEVIPEYIADVGTKKGEKVDYAINIDGSLRIIIECKHYTDKLTLHDTQLLRYFNVTPAKFAVLTNGIIYKFFSDLDETNKMDEKPFFEVDLTNLREVDIAELEKLKKDKFNLDLILNSANELKYTGEIKRYLRDQFDEPEVDFIKYLIAKVYPGRATSKVVEDFTAFVKKSMKSFLSDSVSARLKEALTKQEEDAKQDMPVEPVSNEDRIETTQEELEGFYIVKSILRSKIPSSRIYARDTISYFGVLLDDNNRKPVCRLWFNGKNRHIAIIDASRDEKKFPIESIDDIYKYSKQLIAAAESYQE